MSGIQAVTSWPFEYLRPQTEIGGDAVRATLDINGRCARIESWWPEEGAFYPMLGFERAPPRVVSAVVRCRIVVGVAKTIEHACDLLKSEDLVSNPTEDLLAGLQVGP
jgi:hypothetical protein